MHNVNTVLLAIIQNAYRMAINVMYTVLLAIIQNAECTLAM